MRQLSKEEMYAIDRYTIEKIGITAEILMENAAQSIVRELEKQVQKNERILVLCGSGNNGGDGIAIARILKSIGFTAVDLWMVPPVSSLHGAAKVHFTIYQNCGYSYTAYLNNKDTFSDTLTNTSVIIDALFGIGFRNPPSQPYTGIIRHINTSKARIFSIDIPSGVEADNGDIDIAVKAYITYAIQYPKKSAGLSPAKDFYGQIQIVDIGIPPKAMEALK